MRFALISCIHGNLPALEAVLKAAKQMECATILCLGDIVGYFDQPKPCLELVRTHCQFAVKGNVDEYCSNSHKLSGFSPGVAEAIEQTRAELSTSEKAWLSGLPYHLDIEDFTIVHAGLDAPERWGYIFDTLAAASHFSKQIKPLCFNGHTHVPVAFQSKGSIVTGGTFTTFSSKPDIKYLMNVGSVGQPRDGIFDAAYVIYDAACRMVELRRVGYPRPPSGGDGVGKPAPKGGGSPGTLRMRR
jgi:predicted phosphodiesterase